MKGKKRDGDERWKKKVGRDGMEDGIYGRRETGGSQRNGWISKMAREVEASKEEGVKV